ncbi:DUF732 domain-containing protein [Nocardia transvalensis]|uniref:DUF732 domain-containing protein n=1 Tax=Nocardia transvalensis TaxID=37333 RepID=UPI001895AB66|nr:DUF732 domain-containing protein [Nocardia transvalensis]MBF6333463.1 hypothetical protein [Nocardia transvalensis]
MEQPQNQVKQKGSRRTLLRNVLVGVAVVLVLGALANLGDDDEKKSGKKTGAETTSAVLGAPTTDAGTPNRAPTDPALMSESELRQWKINRDNAFIEKVYALGVPQKIERQRLINAGLRAQDVMKYEGGSATDAGLAILPKVNGDMDTAASVVQAAIEVYCEGVCKATVS